MKNSQKMSSRALKTLQMFGYNVLGHMGADISNIRLLSKTQYSSDITSKNRI